MPHSKGKPTTIPQPSITNLGSPCKGSAISYFLNASIYENHKTTQHIPHQPSPNPHNPSMTRCRAHLWCYIHGLHQSVPQADLGCFWWPLGIHWITGSFLEFLQVMKLVLWQYSQGLYIFISLHRFAPTDHMRPATDPQLECRKRCDQVLKYETQIKVIHVLRPWTRLGISPPHSGPKQYLASQRKHCINVK